MEVSSQSFEPVSQTLENLDTKCAQKLCLSLRMEPSYIYLVVVSIRLLKGPKICLYLNPKARKQLDAFNKI
jgi:hypothetical protein